MPQWTWRRNICSDPLVLLVAAGRAPGEVRIAVAQRHGRRERDARPLAGPDRVRVALLEPELLGAAAEAEAELRDRRRGLQPAAGRRRRDHVAVAVDDVEMHGVAAHDAGAFELAAVAARRQVRIVDVVVGPAPDASDRRLADAGRGEALAAGHADLEPHAEARDVAGPLLHRRLLADELAARVGVGVRQQHVAGHLHEIRIAVEGLAVGIGELRALDHGVDEIGARSDRRRRDRSP